MQNFMGILFINMDRETDRQIDIVFGGFSNIASMFYKLTTTNILIRKQVIQEKRIFVWLIVDVPRSELLLFPKYSLVFHF